MNPTPFSPTAGPAKKYRSFVQRWLCGVILLSFSLVAAAQSKKYSAAKVETLKKELMAEVEKSAGFTQQMNDVVFSFGELGFQELETSRYLTKILRDNGFTVEDGISGIPTAWIARWGSGKPVIAIGSDFDCIPKASQKPGVAYHDPIIEGAPGHGEGHNSGQALNITAALAMKKVMEREKMAGTLVLWPGVAEELVATKAWYVRDGYFTDVDACIFTHVNSNLGVAYGDNGGNGLVSVEYTFEGEAAHAAGAPWRGRSALDAVEMMNVAWNYQREHLPPTQRSHYVVTDGGDQPNVVPSKASVWYYFRDRTYQAIKDMYDAGNRIADGAALMTGTKVTHQLLGTAYPGHFNKPMAEAMYQNIKQVGLPQWSEADQLLAHAVQQEVKAPKTDPKGKTIDGLDTKLDTLGLPVKFSLGGGSDDIADISWNVPTIVLTYPSNIPGLPGHHWANAISMATPIAHKGLTAGAKAEATMLVDLLTKPELIDKSWEYFRTVQTKDQKYVSFVGKDDKPAIHLNEAIMAKYRPEMRKYYYDPGKYKTYLEQLGIAYPTLRSGQKAGQKTDGGK